MEDFLAPGLQRALDLAAGVAILQVAALVALFLAARDRQLDLDAAVSEVEPRRDEGQALLADRAVQRIDLAAVQEELARAGRVVVRAVALVVHGDLRADEPRLAVADLCERLGERRAPVAQRLHLGARERDAGLDAVEEDVVVARTAVVDDQLVALLLRHPVDGSQGASRGLPDCAAAAASDARPVSDTAAQTDPKRLDRSRSDRMVAGVCGGLARYFGIHPAFYRVGFVVLTLLGGAGFLIYAAAALVIPDEGREDSVATDALRHRHERPWPAIGLGLVGLALVVLVSRANFWPAADVVWVIVLGAGAAILWAHRREGARPAARRPRRLLRT